MEGIRKEGDHWCYFNERGDRPWRFADREAARWGSWCSADDARRINETEGRLITMDDIRECIRAATAKRESAERATAQPHQE